MPRDSRVKNILTFLTNHLGFQLDEPATVQRTMKGKLSETRSVLDFGAQPDGEERSAAANREAIQNALDVLKANRGGMLYFPEGVYVIDRPLVIEKETDPGYPYPEEEYNNWLHLIGTSAMIKKSESFVGDRLLTINAFSGDKEESIIIEGLVFNGDDGSVNGVDFFAEHVPYNARRPTCPAEYGYPAHPEDPGYVKYAAGTKYVTFNNCIFSFCYIGARIYGNTLTLSQCQFRGNVCGAYVTTWAHDIRLHSCSFRVGVVGVDIGSGVLPGDIADGCGNVLPSPHGQHDKGAGPVGFHSCIFEDLKASGIRSKGGNLVTVHGGYFELCGHQYARGMAQYANLECMGEYGLDSGAAIHKENGSSGAGSLHVYGAYFAGRFRRVTESGESEWIAQKLLTNSLRNCFVDCNGELNIVPKGGCTFEPAFLHGTFSLTVEDPADLCEEESLRTCFINGAKRIVTAGAEGGYVDAE
jgi:hypothetical protein